MTVVGKIFVILNLLLSLLTGALIMMVFVTRTNWNAEYTRLKANYDTALSNIRAVSEQVQTEQQSKQAAEAAAATAKAAMTQEAASHQQAVLDRDNQIAAFQAQLASTKGNLEAATIDLKRREQEVTNLKGTTTELNTKIDGLEAANKDFRDRAVAAELNFKSEHDRNTLLLAQLEKVTQDFERVQAGGNGRPARAGTVAQRTPSVDMKGTVLESDPKDGLVTISLGSDAGLEVGHVLEVYRQEPNPQYVGKIQIVDAQHKQAVGRARMPLSGGPIRVGDTVASRVR